jgi:hypothetical protein
MNDFKVGDRVKTILGNRTGGTVKYIACHQATQSGGKTCDKKTCQHPIQNYIWVVWNDKSLCSYEYIELAVDHSAETKATSPSTDKASIEEAKTAINKIISNDITRGMSEQDAQIYDGFAQIRRGRNGEAFIHYPLGAPSPHQDKQPVSEQELDWDAYTTQGSVIRKSK